MYCNTNKISTNNLNVSLGAKGSWIVPALFAEQKKMMKAQKSAKDLLHMLNHDIDGTSLPDGTVIQFVFSEDNASDNMVTVLVKMALEAEKEALKALA